MTKLRNAMLALAFLAITAFSVTSIPGLSTTTAVAGEDWYIVNNPPSRDKNKVWQTGHVGLFDAAGGRPANVLCRVPHGQYVEATGRKSAGWIEVRWRKRLGNFEWDYQQYRGGYCPHWKRVGWAWNGWLRYTPRPRGNFVH